MKPLVVYIFFFLLSVNTYGQLREHFEDGEIFSNPIWLGDVSDFEILNNVLHLNAEEAGNSSLYTSIEFPDSIVWLLNFDMRFAPSNSNMLTIYLASSNMNNTNLKAYYLEIGETGSDDGLHFKFIEDNIIEELGVATLGTLASDPATANLKIVYDKEKIWTISADYSGDGNFEDEIEYYDNLFTASDFEYFGISCKYTATRKDKFYFDYFDINEVHRDTSPPSFTNYQLLDKNHIIVEFDEALSPDDIDNITNFKINPVIPILEINWSLEQSKQVLITTVTEFESGVVYQMEISNLFDNNGNKIMPFSFNFNLVEKAISGDLVINEVLFNPYNGGQDFIEIFNKSSKTIKMDSLGLINKQSGSLVVIRTDKTLKSDEILAITSDKSSLQSIYSKYDSNHIIEHKIPSMNNGNGNISLYNLADNKMILLDSFDYDEEMHFALLEDYNGVSLERININDDTNNEANWHSAASTSDFATPGVPNSITVANLLHGNDMFTMNTKVFSPDGDSYEPLMNLSYALDYNDYLANVSVYDYKGFWIKDLIINQTLPTRGIITWDGSDANNQLAMVGIYIIHINCNSQLGKSIKINKTCVLAREL